MASSPIKKYTITGSKWSSQHLAIQHEGIPFLWINANNKYGPWKAPFVTIHRDKRNGEIVAAAKMGLSGWARDFRIFLGNPDCTDLNTWPLVRCKGKSAYEYRFSVAGQEFAWRRTRNKQLGAQRKGHRDFKLVALTPATSPPAYKDVVDPCMNGEECLIDYDSSDADELPPRIDVRSSQNQAGESERVVAIYFMDTHFKSNSRESKIHFFEDLPSEETELWCLAAVLGLQEKISRNQEAFMWASFGYGGGLRPLGNYI